MCFCVLVRMYVCVKKFKSFAILKRSVQLGLLLNIAAGVHWAFCNF